MTKVITCGGRKREKYGGERQGEGRENKRVCKQEGDGGREKERSC